MDHARVVSVNVGASRPMLARTGCSGIDKRPVTVPVAVGVPDAGRSGVDGDFIGDPESHGGPDQAVYAYGREDLDWWQAELGSDLVDGAFGENLTTAGIEVTGAEIGERWAVGPDLVLEVTSPRTPCRTFAAWLRREGWIRTFTERAVPGAYFRVLAPGSVRAGDALTVMERPGHGVTVGLVFRAITTEPELLPQVRAVDALAAELRERVLRRVGA
jgi:MOSC domain-containing protein YiiM